MRCVQLLMGVIVRVVIYPDLLIMFSTSTGPGKINMTKCAFDLKEQLSAINNLNSNHVPASFDAVCLFTNTSVKKVVNLINSSWVEIIKFTTIKSKSIFIEGIEMCLNE